MTDDAGILKPISERSADLKYSPNENDSFPSPTRKEAQEFISSLCHWNFEDIRLDEYSEGDKWDCNCYVKVTFLPYYGGPNISFEWRLGFNEHGDVALNVYEDIYESDTTSVLWHVLHDVGTELSRSRKELMQLQETRGNSE